MAKFTQTYPTDLKYTEWLLRMDFFPTHRLGRPRTWEMWQTINAILYDVRTDRPWCMMPTNLPPWQTIYGYFWRWKRQGLWERSIGHESAYKSGAQPETECSDY